MADEKRTPLFSAFSPVSTEAWEQQIEDDLAGDEQPLIWHPPEGFAVRPFYRAEDTDELAHVPYARHVAPSRGWQIRQDIYAPDLDAAHRQALAALDGGAEAVGFRAQADGDTVRGIPVQTPADMHRLLDGLPLRDCALHLAGGPAALPLLALLLGEAERQGMDPDALTGSVNHDPLSTLARSGTLKLDAALGETAALLRETSGALLHLRLLAADATPYHEAGATAVQELAFVGAAVSDYLARLIEAGCPAKMIYRRLHLIVPVGSRYLLEIAKLRALRLLLAQIVSAHAHAPPAPDPAYIQAFTSRRRVEQSNPQAHLLRAPTAAASAVLGGADTLVVQPPRTAASPPDDTALRLARNAQLILREEAHFSRVADPAGGAYHIEVLTDKLARHAWSLFQEVEARGGLVEALRAGFVQQQIAKARQRQPDRALAPEPTARPAVSGPARYDPQAPLASRRQAFREGAALNDLLSAYVSGDTAIRICGR